MVGIGSGAYSSIFIGAPLLAMFKEREPEYARRRDDDAIPEVSVGGVLLETPETPTPRLRFAPRQRRPLPRPRFRCQPPPQPSASEGGSDAAAARTAGRVDLFARQDSAGAESCG